MTGNLARMMGTCAHKWDDENDSVNESWHAAPHGTVALTCFGLGTAALYKYRTHLIKAIALSSVPFVISIGNMNAAVWKLAFFPTTYGSRKRHAMFLRRHHLCHYLIEPFVLQSSLIEKQPNLLSFLDARNEIH